MVKHLSKIKSKNVSLFKESDGKGLFLSLVAVGNWTVIGQLRLQFPSWKHLKNHCLTIPHGSLISLEIFKTNLASFLHCNRSTPPPPIPLDRWLTIVRCYGASERSENWILPLEKNCHILTQSFFWVSKPIGAATSRVAENLRTHQEY